MRRLLAPLTALAIVIAALLLLPDVQMNADGAPVLGLAGVQQEDPCTVESTVTAGAAELAVGEQVDVTTTVTVGCPDASYGPLHIVLVMQASQFMAQDPDSGEHPRQEIRDAASDLMDRLDLAANPWIRIGIVEYNDSANRLCDLTNDREELDDCLRSLRATGDTRLDAAVREAGSVLSRGRRGYGDSLEEWIILVGDGSNDYANRNTPRPVDGLLGRSQAEAGCDPVVEEVQKITDDAPDVRIGALCLASGCNRTCLQRVTSSPTLIFSTPQINTFLQFMDRIVQQMSRGGPVSSVIVTETLAAELSYVPDSSDPLPESQDGQTISWRWGNPEEGALVATMRVEAVQPGEISLCTSSSGTVSPRGASVMTFELDCPTLTISGDVEPSTETPAPTATATDASPIPDATPTPTPSATATQDAGEPTIYLPWALSGAEIR